MQYIGVGRDTSYGLVLRNHYWLGDMLGDPKEAVEKADQLGLYLLLHDSNEFSLPLNAWCLPE